MLKAVLVFKTHVWVLWKPDTSCFNAEVLRNTAGASMCSLFSKGLTSVMCVETVGRFDTCLESKAEFCFCFSVVLHSYTWVHTCIFSNIPEIPSAAGSKYTLRWNTEVPSCSSQVLMQFSFHFGTVFPVFSLLSFMLSFNRTDLHKKTLR